MLCYLGETHIIASKVLHRSLTKIVELIRYLLDTLSKPRNIRRQVKLVRRIDVEKRALDTLRLDYLSNSLRVRYANSRRHLDASRISGVSNLMVPL